MNLINKKDYPELFEDISEFIIDNSVEEHRRGSTFYTQSIVEFKEEFAKFFTSIENFNQFIGTWETNQYIASEDYTDWSDINTLTRVEKKPVIVETYEWSKVA